MKPIALLVARQPSAIADDEFHAIARMSGLDEADLHRIQLSAVEPADIRLDDYAAVIVTGSPYNFTINDSQKSPGQLLTESNLAHVNAQILDRDFPYFGICYGLEAIGIAAGTELTGEWREEISPPWVELTEAATQDKIFSQVPTSFHNYTGHSEALANVPDGFTLLASSETCPVQAVRYGENVYGVQFHPEIDWDSLQLRINRYAGKYYDAGEAQRIYDNCKGRNVSAGATLLKTFVETYRG